MNSWPRVRKCECMHHHRWQEKCETMNCSRSNFAMFCPCSPTRRCTCEQNHCILISLYALFSISMRSSSSHTSHHRPHHQIWRFLSYYVLVYINQNIMRIICDIFFSDTFLWGTQSARNDDDDDDDHHTFYERGKRGGVSSCVMDSSLPKATIHSTNSPPPTTTTTTSNTTNSPFPLLGQLTPMLFCLSVCSQATQSSHKKLKQRCISLESEENVICKSCT